MKKLIVGALAAISIALGVAPPASAYGYDAVRGPSAGGFLGSQWRTVFDGPRRPDGSWERERRIWTPAGYVPRSTYCGTYSCSSSGGYYREESATGYERYLVFDVNVLPDEPGWLPEGTLVIR